MEKQMKVNVYDFIVSNNQENEQNLLKLNPRTLLVFVIMIS